MPEDVRTDDEVEATEAATPEIVHDDIVKRLLDYQRQLREGLDATPAPVATTEDLVDLTTVDADGASDVVDVSAADVSSDTTDAVASDDPTATDVIALDEASTETPTIEIATGDASAVEDASGAATEESSADVIVLHPDTPVGSTTAPAIDGAATAGAWPGADAGAASSWESAASPTGAEGSRDEAADRILELERSLEQLASRFDELRSSFQDMAIAADRRLAEIEDLIAEVRRAR